MAIGHESTQDPVPPSRTSSGLPERVAQIPQDRVPGLRGEFKRVRASLRARLAAPTAQGPAQAEVGRQLLVIVLRRSVEGDPLAKGPTLAEPSRSRQPGSPARP